VIAPTTADDARYVAEQATPETALFVADHIRDRDALEIRRWADETPAEHIVRNTIEALPFAWIVRAPSGNPCNVFGYWSEDGVKAQAWLFSTEETERARMTLCKTVRKAAQFGKRVFKNIVLYSDPQKEDARRFNEFCGFRFVGDEEIDGMCVMKFEA